MIPNAKYAHTNVIARDWRALSHFYQRVFGCLPVPPERDYAGPDLEAGTGVPGSAIKGVHLRLPGQGPNGPTLEIYSYSITADPVRPEVNRPGFAHIAFVVSDVRTAQQEVINEGGGTIGDIVTLETTTGARVTWCYVRDPEGNIIELQSWS
ncbi:MAG: VOC family protein [Thermodesulfobacteriota bacterium]|jgi:predicted enzyme related to lactoylglutathione lyase